MFNFNLKTSQHKATAGTLTQSLCNLRVRYQHRFMAETLLILLPNTAKCNRKTYLQKFIKIKNILTKAQDRKI